MEIYRLPKVIEMTGLAKTTIYKKMAAGTFPLPRKLTSKTVGWTSTSVLDWMENLEEAEIAETNEVEA